jgi:hypothetical protein
MSIANLERRLINKSNQTTLTSYEISSFFQEASQNLGLVMLLLEQALKRGLITPDASLLQAISHSRDVNSLYTVALSLRYGGNPNMYVNAPKLGTIHILAYTYYLLHEKADRLVLNTIALLLLAKGARPVLPVYDRGAGRIRSDPLVEGEISQTIDLDGLREDVEIEVKPSRHAVGELSVKDWLVEQGYTNAFESLTQSNLRESVKSQDLRTLAILLDQPELLTPEIVISRDEITRAEVKPLSDQDSLPTIRARSGKVLETIASTTSSKSQEKILMDSKAMVQTVNLLFEKGFTILLDKGITPSYLLINRLLILIRQYHEQQHFIARQELVNMLVDAIKRGTQLDTDQLAIISPIGADLINTVITTYQQPYWRKACSAQPKDIPNELRQVALSLDIEGSVCNQLEQLAQSDPAVLAEAASKRQQLRMSAKLGTVQEFISGTPSFVCRNATLLSHPPSEYNSLNLAYYRDEQDAVWCFSSDMFPGIVETGVNPNNQAKLPESFREEVRYQMKIIQSLGLDIKNPVTVTQSLNQLVEKDKISALNSEKAVNLFLTRAADHGVSPQTIKKLSKEQMTAILKLLGYNGELFDFTPLTNSHALTSFARTGNYLIVTDTTTLANELFRAISAQGQ